MSAIHIQDADNRSGPTSHRASLDPARSPRIMSPHHDPDDSLVEESLADDFVAQPRTVNARTPSPQPAHDDLSSSWLSLSDPGSSTSGFPSSDDHEGDLGGLRPDSPEEVSLNLSSSWIDAEARSTSEQASPRLGPSSGRVLGSHGRDEVHGALPEGHLSTDTLHRGDLMLPSYGEGQKEMSSIEKVTAWVKPADLHGTIGYDHAEQHNADLIFPTLDASMQGTDMQGTDSCETIKRATRFNRSASESTVKLMSSDNRSGDVRQSFLSDATDPEGGSECSLDHDLEGISDQRDAISASEGEELDEWDLASIERELGVGRSQTGERGIGHQAELGREGRLGRYSERVITSARATDRKHLESRRIDSHDVGPSQSQKERDQAVGKFWMEEVGKRAVSQPETRAWADAVSLNNRFEESSLKRRRYDRLRNIAFLALPFITLAIVAMLTRPSIGAILPAGHSKARHPESHPGGIRPNEQPAQQAAEFEVHDFGKVAGQAAEVIPAELRVMTPDAKPFLVQVEESSGSSGPASVKPRTRKDQLDAGAKRMAGHFRRFVPTHFAGGAVSADLWSVQRIHVGIRSIRLAIHRASVALIGTLAKIPKGAAVARARFNHWVAPALERTTSLVMIDGKDAYQSALMEIRQAIQHHRNSLDRAYLRTKKKASRVEAGIVDLTFKTGVRVRHANALWKDQASRTVDSVRRTLDLLPQRFEVTISGPAHLILSRARNISDELRSRIIRHNDLTKGRKMASARSQKKVGRSCKNETSALAQQQRPKGRFSFHRKHQQSETSPELK